MIPFIGQEKLNQELDQILKDMLNFGKNYNVLFAAPSGYGKTNLALRCVTCLGNFDKCTYSVGNAEHFLYEREKRFHILDEAHNIKEPEFLYPYMDSGNFSFFILTNEQGLLKEPLINRCISLIFKPYTLEEIMQMVACYLATDNEIIIKEVARRCKGSPRIAKNLCTRVSYFLRSDMGFDINSVLTEIMNISPEGLNELDQRYLDFLKQAGGKASLDLISYGTRIDKTTILRDIEPGLISINKIKVTSKGRQLL